MNSTPPNDRDVAASQPAPTVTRLREEPTPLDRPQSGDSSLREMTIADPASPYPLMLSAFLDHSDMLVWIKDERGRLTFANRNWLSQFGLIQNNALGKTDFELFAPEMAAQFRAKDLEVLGGHECVRDLETTVDASGATRCWQITRFPFHNSSGERYIGGLAHDVTERLRQDEEIRQLAITDPLTGLLNRRGFFALAGPELMRARRRWSGCTMIFLDLDALKSVNDRLGHEAGDSIIQLTALILKKVFRETDIIARIGGDEFAVFAPDSQGDVEVIRNRLMQAAESLDSNPILKAQLEFSVGVLSCDPALGGTLEVLLSQADSLMYEHKRSKQAATN